jgi:ribosomal protein L14E/L6E/L27E
VKKAIGGGKNGKEREVPAVKAPKWYPADDIKAKVPSDREAHSRGVAKLKKTIKPGSVLILLGGRFRGKRVVFLKQLSSGLLLVTGPYQLNGVPLRRVNQAYCISTSASVDVKGADVSKIDDAFFARTKKPKSKKDGEEFFGDAAEVRPRRPSPAAAPPPVRQEGRPRRQDGEMGAGRCGAATGDGRTAGGTRRCPCGGRLRLLVVGPVRGGGGGLREGSVAGSAVQQWRAAVACGGLGPAARAGTGGSETQAAAQP